MTLHWTENTKPDRPGIWLRKSDVNGSMHTVNVYETNLDSQPFGTYCFHADWPVIADPPKYRAVTAADVGREIEVKTEGKWRSEGRTLIGFMSSGHVVYELNATGWPYSALPDHARILDTGPVKQREPPLLSLAIGETVVIDGEQFRLTGRTKHTEQDLGGARDRVCTLRFVREVIADACGSKG